ncbi:MAG: ABC transporter ATP-binding protein [Pseudomonadota bacterium]
MSFETAIMVSGVSKCFNIYESPRDRLKQFIFPRLQQVLSLEKKKYFREFWALKSVSFDVFRGETVGIIGRNGSGKSTLLQIICDTLSPSEGAVSVRGRVAALLELGSGFNPEFSGMENIRINAAVLGLSDDQISERLDRIISFSEIGQFIHQPVKTYSSGMMVRLAFSVAINVDPDILVIDEALSVGDERFQRKCLSKIESLKRDGATILFVSHSGAQIVELCDRAVLLDSGRLLMVGPPKDAIKEYQRLLYSPESERENIRNRLLSKKTGTSNFVDVNYSFSEVETAADNRGESEERETFDPTFVSTSEVIFESHGPVISPPVILTLSGEQVNGLVRGRRYRVRYSVSFCRSASNVRFGMSFRTATGVAISGVLSSPSLLESIPAVREGAIANVTFEFSCRLNTGVYFLNVGVFGCVGEEEVVLHRRAETIVFRVLPVQRNIVTEAVCFEYQPLIELFQDE